MKSCLLIASPQMKDPFFAGTVILLCQHDDNGALGLVINRETSLAVQAVLDQLGVSLERKFSQCNVHWGGPVEPGAGFIVFPGAVLSEEGWNVGDGVAVSPSRDRLCDALAKPSAFLLCLGYAGWGPGQLDGEIGSGSWLIAEIESALVLEVPIDERYDRALAQLGLTSDAVWMQPVDE